MPKILIKVHPGAGRSEITSCKNSIWQIKIGAPPEKGKANKELIEYLAGVLGIAKSGITIDRGLTGRNKFVSVEGIAVGDMEQKLQAAVKPHD
jgi:uncharacterized protein (TIGR00251 family)